MNTLLATMLILKGLHGVLDADAACKYAYEREYQCKILEAPDELQVQRAVEAIKKDSSIQALYGFSMGGYNIRHVLGKLNSRTRARIKLVIVLGAPRAPRSAFEGTWELIYQKAHNQEIVN